MNPVSANGIANGMASGAAFGFERPLLLVLGVALIALSIAVSRKFKNVFTVSLPLGPPGGTSFKPPFNIDGLIKVLRVFEYAGVLLLFVAAAGPVIKTTETVWLNRGADILFVLDISPSMAALDMDGASRFNTARALLREFAEKRPSDGIGLAAVGNDAALLVPLTTDREALFYRLEQLKLGELGDGTALGMGLATAAFHLEKSDAPRRAVVLITDGENNAGAIHPETAAAMLEELGVSLWVIGIGSGGEVPIDYTDPVTRIHRTGLFDSRYNTESLRDISTAGRGTWLSAPSSDALAAAFARIDEREMVVRRSGVVGRRHSVHVPFCIAAIALIAGTRSIRRLFLGAWL